MLCLQGTTANKAWEPRVQRKKRRCLGASLFLFCLVTNQNKIVLKFVVRSVVKIFKEQKMQNLGLIKTVVAVGCMFVATGHVSAQSLEGQFSPEGAVFTRTFSADYLEKHGDQQVEKIQFEQLPTSHDKSENTENSGGQPEDVSGVAFSVMIKFRDSEQPFESRGMCFPGGDVMDCRIDCDGSGFTLKSDSKSSVLLLNSEGFQLNGCSIDGAEARSLKPTESDSVFRLDAGSNG